MNAGLDDAACRQNVSFYWLFLFLVPTWNTYPQISLKKVFHISVYISSFMFFFPRMCYLKKMQISVCDGNTIKSIER